MDSNPYRSPGDALKQWKERLKIVDESMDANKEEDAAPESKGKYLLFFTLFMLPESFFSYNNLY